DESLTGHRHACEITLRPDGSLAVKGDRMARGSHVRVIISILLALGWLPGAGWAAGKERSCTAAKRIAAGRKALGNLECFAAAARKAGGFSAVCLEKQHLQLLKAFSKAEHR